MSRDELVKRAGGSPTLRPQTAIKRLVRRIATGRNKVAARISSDLIGRLQPGALVLVIGGGTVGDGAEALYASEKVHLISTDIYASESTDLIADGHDLPFADGAVDAVWVQAVLEHVLDPRRVAEEAHRVLRHGGYIFADTPLIQQVHEGAYDFTRFTVSGHRWLFKDFSIIEAGATSGAGTALIWSIRYFFRAVTGSNKIARLVSMLFFWLRFFDSDSRAHKDAACGVYFYGVKEGRTISKSEIVKFYDQQLRL